MRPSLVLACLLSRATAHAQGAGDEAIALALFAEGKQLAAQDDYLHACEKYEAARSLQPWLGVELNLADCYERLGKTASAWVLFRKASDDADKLADPRGPYARERADKLEPQLSHITIASHDDVRLDDKPVPAAGLGSPLPIDPGEHVVSAVTPGHVEWSRRVTIAPSASLDVVVPPLEPERVPRFDARLPPVRPHRDRPWLALSLGGVGAAAIGASLLLGVDAKLRYDDAHGCTAQLVCDPASYAAIRSARTRGDIATIVGGAGIATIAAAFFIYFRAPVAPMAAPGVLGISVQGSL